MPQIPRRSKSALIEFVSDVDGSLSSKRLIGYLSFAVVLIMWIGSQFFAMDVHEFMFEGFMLLVAAGMGTAVLEKFSLARDRTVTRTYESYSYSKKKEQTDGKYVTLDSQSPHPENHASRVLGDYDPNGARE